MAKTLKIWNGRGLSCRKYGDEKWRALPSNADVHAYVAAYSRADARRVIEAYCGRAPSDTELKDYFHEGAWGNDMEDVTVERGLWLRWSRSEKPVRVA